MPRAKTKNREVTEKDLEENPSLREQGVEVGDIMRLPVVDDEDIEDEEDDFVPPQLKVEPKTDSKGQVEFPPKTSIVGTPLPVPETQTAKNSVSFKVRNPNRREGYNVRTFSKLVHGESWHDLANEFHSTNAIHILARKDDIETSN